MKTILLNRACLVDLLGREVTLEEKFRGLVRWLEPALSAPEMVAFMARQIGEAPICADGDIRVIRAWIDLQSPEALDGLAQVIWESGAVSEADLTLEATEEVLLEMGRDFGIEIRLTEETPSMETLMVSGGMGSEAAKAKLESGWASLVEIGGETVKPVNPKEVIRLRREGLLSAQAYREAIVALRDHLTMAMAYSDEEQSEDDISFRLLTEGKIREDLADLLHLGEPVEVRPALPPMVTITPINSGKVYFGFGLAPSMFPDEPFGAKGRPLSPEEAREVIAGGVEVCLNPSHALTIDAMRQRFGIEVAIPAKAPVVKLEGGDRLLVMGVSGLPRLEGRHEYTPEEIDGAKFTFQFWGVETMRRCTCGSNVGWQNCQEGSDYCG